MVHFRVMSDGICGVPEARSHRANCSKHRGEIPLERLCAEIDAAYAAWCERRGFHNEFLEAENLFALPIKPTGRRA